jgi:hypothetical protein
VTRGAGKRRILTRGPVRPVRPKVGIVDELAADMVHLYPSPDGGPFVFASGGGPILDAPSIKPIFWGSEWGSADRPLEPSAILSAINTIVTGPYLNLLGQYGIDARVTVQGAMYVVDSDPPATPTLDDLATATTDLLHRLIDDEQLPEPDENWAQFNVVFLASTTDNPADSDGNVASGAHSTFQWVDWDLLDDDDDPVRYAFVCTQSDGSHSALDSATATFAHELVEAMTDPDLNAWRQRPDMADEGELADVCPQVGRLDGVAVSAYWSNADGRCVIPTQDRRCFLPDPQVTETATSNGPDQHADVDRQCGPDHHWTASYTYHGVEHALTTTLTAVTPGYADPSGTWAVSGVTINPVDDRPRHPKLNASFPHLAGPPTELEVRTTITLVVTDTTLQIITDPKDGNFTLPVTYTVIERSDDLAPPITQSQYSLDVEIEGLTLWAPDEFWQAQETCLREQTGAIHQNMTDLGYQVDQLEDFLHHGGPPVDQHTLDTLERQSFELSRRLRDHGRAIRAVNRLRFPS